MRLLSSVTPHFMFLCPRNLNNCLEVSRSMYLILESAVDTMASLEYVNWMSLIFLPFAKKPRLFLHRTLEIIEKGEIGLWSASKLSEAYFQLLEPLDSWFVFVLKINHSPLMFPETSLSPSGLNWTAVTILC
jgi:hypothetical protein